MTKTPKVTILLATYNGGKFLEEQLQSLASQSLAQVDVLVSDDGSADNTLTLLNDWQQKWVKGSFTILKGPQKGFSENFRFLIKSLECPDTFVAFCDQDDIWHINKLDKAVQRLIAAGDETKSMYGCRSRLIDVEGKEIGMSPLFQKQPSFGNALVQSLAGANTIVMNPAGFTLLQESARRTGFISHDWWCYQLFTAAGGAVLFDAEPQIDYRQHANNVFGRNTGVKAIWRRIAGLFSGEFSGWLTSNLGALEKCNDLLLPVNTELLRKFQAVRKKNGIRRVVFLWQNNIRRQTTMANFALYSMALLGRL